MFPTGSLTLYRLRNMDTPVYVTMKTDRNVTKTVLCAATVYQLENSAASIQMWLL